MVAAAGNDFASICGEPAFDPNILCVVSTDRNETRSSFSNFGVSQCPGQSRRGARRCGTLFCADDLVSTVPSSAGGFCTDDLGVPSDDAYAGTSMATPHVAGVAALLTAEGRSCADVIRSLKQTARTPVLGVRGVYTPVFGHGIVDAQAAVAAP